MIEKLPYWLTDGVVATEGGLRFIDATRTVLDDDGMHKETTGLLNALQQLGKLQARVDGLDAVVFWYDVAERLRYCEGEPWCHDYIDAIVCYDPHTTPNAKGVSNPLNRLAAVLCDDGDAFRILHWCVNNLGGDK